MFCLHLRVEVALLPAVPILDCGVCCDIKQGLPLQSLLCPAGVSARICPGARQQFQLCQLLWLAGLPLRLWLTFNRQ